VLEQPPDHDLSWGLPVLSSDIGDGRMVRRILETRKLCLQSVTDTDLTTGIRVQHWNEWNDWNGLELPMN
jgi:hypothetical protein